MLPSFLHSPTQRGKARKSRVRHDKKQTPCFQGFKKPKALHLSLPAWQSLPERSSLALVVSRSKRLVALSMTDHWIGNPTKQSPTGCQTDTFCVQGILQPWRQTHMLASLRPDRFCVPSVCSHFANLPYCPSLPPWWQQHLSCPPKRYEGFPFLDLANSSSKNVSCTRDEISSLFHCDKIAFCVQWIRRRKFWEKSVN